VGDSDAVRVHAGGYYVLLPEALERKSVGEQIQLIVISYKII
jgi:hypothetical protein